MLDSNSCSLSESSRSSSTQPPLNRFHSMNGQAPSNYGSNSRNSAHFDANIGLSSNGSSNSLSSLNSLNFNGMGNGSSQYGGANCPQTSPPFNRSNQNTPYGGMSHANNTTPQLSQFNMNRNGTGPQFPNSIPSIPSQTGNQGMGMGHSMPPRNSMQMNNFSSSQERFNYYEAQQSGPRPQRMQSHGGIQPQGPASFHSGSHNSHVNSSHGNNYCNSNSMLSHGANMYGSNSNSNGMQQQQHSNNMFPSRNGHQPATTNYYSDNNTSSSNSSSSNSGFPPIGDFQIGTFTLGANGVPTENGSEGTNRSFTSNNANNTDSNQNVRETGIIEKLLQTYGFIQCCERQARLFFHFSQFDGNTDHLRIGDPVEFEVTFDRRTGKPIASSVLKISPEVVLSEERVVGVVTTELNETGSECNGRISYENRGECFFLPYGKDDVEGYVTLKPGDKVSFQIATNQRTGTLTARHVRLENPTKPVRYQGVVSAMKEDHGYIERADVVDEICFHVAETTHIPGGLKPGDDVDFCINTVNGKEVAMELVKLEVGSVVFEDTSQELVRGQVLKTVERNSRYNSKDPLPGRIRYRANENSEPMEVKFGERDQQGEFTLRHGDWVEFNIATDRRDRMQKATNIRLLDDSFRVSGERREFAVVHTVCEDFGYLLCHERELLLHFHFREFLSQISLPPHVGQEVVFTAAQDENLPGSNKMTATRMKIIPETHPWPNQDLNRGCLVSVQKSLHGWVQRLAKESPKLTLPAVPGSIILPKPSFGAIVYRVDDTINTIEFRHEDAENVLEHLNQMVIFDACFNKRHKRLLATRVRMIADEDEGYEVMRGLPENIRQMQIDQEMKQRQCNKGEEVKQASVAKAAVAPVAGSAPEQPLPKALHGFVVFVDGANNSGIIEAWTRDAEVPFHSSVVSHGSKEYVRCTDISLGSEVAYVLHRDHKYGARSVTLLQAGTVPQRKVLPGQHCGVVSRPVRPPPSEAPCDVRRLLVREERPYPGLVTRDDTALPFARSSLADLKAPPRMGEIVNYQIDEDGWAVNIMIASPEKPQPKKKQHLHGFIATLKENIGFIETVAHDKDVFFHFSNVEGTDPNTLELGDEVQYTIDPKTTGNAKVSADSVSVLPKGTLPLPPALDAVYNGLVIRPIRSNNLEQEDYCGLIAVDTDDIEQSEQYQFGITGVVNKRELLQKGDSVTFQTDTSGWATNIVAVRQKFSATVDTVKGNYGFLNYEAEEGKKLFFHQTEVEDKSALAAGDEVEFVIITNQKTGKSSACNITRRQTGQRRPLRLMKASTHETPRRVQVLRQPRGPEGQGFTAQRDRNPAVLRG